MSHLQWPLGHVGLRECNLNNNKIPASKALSKFPAKIAHKNSEKMYSRSPDIYANKLIWYDMILCCNDKKNHSSCRLYVRVIHTSLDYFGAVLKHETTSKQQLMSLIFFCAFPSSRRDPFSPLLRLQNQKGVGGQKSIGQDHHLLLRLEFSPRWERWRGG